MDEELLRVENQMYALDENLHSGMDRENGLLAEKKQLKELLRMRDNEIVAFKSELKFHLDHTDSQ
jgi:hypothetical protein